MVLDNLVFGHRDAVGPPRTIPFYDVNLGDEVRCGLDLAQKEKIEVVMHFAAYAYVGEIGHGPVEILLQQRLRDAAPSARCMLGEGREEIRLLLHLRHLRHPRDKMPIVENRCPQAPINPYGQTKLDIENALKSVAHAHGLSFAAFRYFNAAGAAEDGSIGE